MKSISITSIRFFCRQLAAVGPAEWRAPLEKIAEDCELLLSDDPAIRLCYAEVGEMRAARQTLLEWFKELHPPGGGGADLGDGGLTPWPEEPGPSGAGGSEEMEDTDGPCAESAP